MLFKYPESAVFNRVVPKSKIYDYGRASARLKQLFVDQVGKIIWKYKLSTDTINLASRPAVPEIQVFEVEQRVAMIKEDVLRCIDNAIAFPIFFELRFEAVVQNKAAYKRPSVGDSSKWVVGDYFEADWQPADSERSALPVSLDLAGLYEQLLRRLMPLPARNGESLKAHADRLATIRSKQRECDKLEARVNREKQFNRKVELNAELRTIKDELKSLIGQVIEESRT